jgi:hypothetical protein
MLGCGDMRPLSPIVSGVSLGLVTEAFIAFYATVSGFVSFLSQTIGPCDSAPPSFLVLLLLHYPGLFLAEHLHIHKPMAFWLSAVVSGILWSAIWFLVMKICVYVKRAA